MERPYRFESLGTNGTEMSVRSRLPLANIEDPGRSSREGLIAEQPNALSAGYILDSQRKVALDEVDQAKFSLFHVKVALVAGIGFFTDAYDTFAIDLVIIMAQVVYGPTNLTPARTFGLKAASTCGTIVGQLLFGWLGDVYGRKRMYGVELVIIIIGTFGQALAGQAHRVNIFAVITFYRFIMGIGIGGDYPLSSILSAEFSPTRFRGRLMTLVFSTQGWGQLTAAIVSISALSAFQVSVDPDNIDSVWRFLIGFGCIPAAIALFFRLTIPESPRYTMDIERNVNQANDDVERYIKEGDFTIDPDAIIQRAEAPRASWRDFMMYFRQWDNLKVLLGTSWSWFALDIAFYGMNLNTPILFDAVYPTCTSATSPATYLEDLSRVNIILSLGGLLPGFIFSFFLIDSWGRRPIQLLGFCVLSVIFLIVGFAYNRIVSLPKVFFFLYCLANFFQNFGPNTTTFIIPGEVFPTRYRSTAFGIAAASGKVGAIIAQVCFYAVQIQQSSSTVQASSSTGSICPESTDVKTVLTIFAFFMISGIASTYFLIPETKGLSLETLSNERQDGFITGVATRVGATEDGLVISARLRSLLPSRTADIGNGL